MPKISFANEQCLQMISEFEKNNFCGEAYSYDTLASMLTDNYLLKNNDNIFVLLEEEELIGYIIFHINDEFTDIYKIYIRENDRRKHYANMFIDYVYNLAKRYKSKKMMVEVRSKNNVALSFYDSVGFKKISERQAYYKNPTDDAIILEKIIEV